MGVALAGILKATVVAVWSMISHGMSFLPSVRNTCTTLSLLRFSPVAFTVSPTLPDIGSTDLIDGMATCAGKDTATSIKTTSKKTEDAFIGNIPPHKCYSDSPPIASKEEAFARSAERALRRMQCGQRVAGFALHLFVQTVAMRVHGDDGQEALHSQVPHGFGDAEFQQVHIENFLDVARVNLRGAADGVQIH